MIKKAFTLVEILLTLAIMSITMILVMPFGINQINQEDLSATTEDVVSRAFSTQIDGFAGINNSSHGIWFGSNTYIVFEGESLATATSQIEYVLPSNFSFINISFNDATTELVIQKGSIIPSTFGTVSLTNQDQTNQISINREGKISIQKL